jgi:predicted TIM-barrel fold metal-dependent hydrolase
MSTRSISRRDALFGSIVAGLAVASGHPRRVLSAQPSLTPVNFQVPPRACDCHVHIFGETAKFPFSPGRTYTPPPALVPDLLARHRVLHMDRVVVVQPSVYGTDNSCTLDALQQLGSRARGVAVIAADTSEAALDAMHRQGVRGIRINLGTAGVTDPEVARQRLRDAIARVKNRRWHIQMFTQLSVVEALKADLAASPVPVVFDHFAQAQGSAGVQQPGFATLVNLVGTAKAFVKISAPYLCSTKAPDYEDMQPLARALVDANPRQILWGSNWPHPDSTAVAGRAATAIAPPLAIDEGHVLNLLPAWVPDASRRQMILVDNPARLYEF